MTFIISNNLISRSKQVFDVYIKGNFVKKDSHLLIFQGYLYPEYQFDNTELLKMIIEHGINIITDLKGYFCGIYYNFEKKELFFFTDRFGNYDLYYYISNEIFIISDNFNDILRAKEFSLNDINTVSVYEFVFFEYPLFEKTFIKSIEYLPLGTIVKIDLKSNSLMEIRYYDYRFQVNTNFKAQKVINELDKLFDKSIIRIKKINPPQSVYGLGLSGGMDSRLTAYYAVKHKLRLKTFIYGEKKSDAYFIAKKIANLLKLEHFELGYKKDFYEYSKNSINFNPMMNVLYAWYYAVFKDLPDFEVLLTGYNGDNQFGSHLEKSDLFIRTDEEFSDIIFEKYCELGNVAEILKYFKDPSIYSKIKRNVQDFSKKSINSEYWQKKEEFNYKFRQRRYIKNNPSFNFLGKFQSFSMFIDLDLMDLFMTIPFEFRLNRNLFYNFLKKKLPFLSKIRPERDIPILIKNELIKSLFKRIQYYDTKFRTHIIFKKDHKSINKWLSNDKDFIYFLKKIFSNDNELFSKLFDIYRINRLISKGNWTSFELNILFRFLTLKLFLDFLKENSLR